MQVSYYPGCTLHGLAAEYDESIRAVCKALDIDLEELDDWNCCGASSAHFLDDELAIRLSASNMAIAERAGRDLLVPCSACFQRLKHADRELRDDATRWIDEPYDAQSRIFHVNDFLVDSERLTDIQRAVKQPLAGLAGVPYYGCLSQKPPKLTEAASPENPTQLDELMRVTGMEVRKWSYKTDCCGASLTLTRPDLVRRLSGGLLTAAVEAGAECLVTDCPMCQSNLDTLQRDIEIELDQQFELPVFYITELLALAFGKAQARQWWKKHFVNPIPLLESKGLL